MINSSIEAAIASSHSTALRKPLLAIQPEAIAEAISTFLLIAVQATRACKGLSQSNGILLGF